MVAEPQSYRAAVLGAPIAHSLSPVLHRSGYAAAGLDRWRYDAIEVQESELAGFVAGLDATWRGLSLTMPLKEVAFEVADSVSDMARRAGAINTLIRREDLSWGADNTDVIGIVESLRGVDHDGAALIIGAGATARSAVVALTELGLSDVILAARRPEPAEALVRFAQEQGLRARAIPLTQWAEGPPRLVLSTVPVTAGPALVEAARDASGGVGGCTGTLFDVVYVPWPSPLAAAVQAAGGRTIPGIEMLIHQAARQFELFTGVPADLAAMQAAGRAAAGV